MDGHHDNPLEDEEVLDAMKNFSLDGCWFLMAVISIIVFINHLWSI
jgi:hypothetical protein